MIAINGMFSSAMKVVMADDATAEARREICAVCPELKQPLGRCSKCGCIVKAKTALKNQSCPLKKW